ncbi:MAG: hypothetical protein LBU51_11305, partial [Bacteroidales bacterium]|nr:hypothetical protein [Bacteroidales bacterium]
IFHKINNYIKSIPQDNLKHIDYCISLFNRLGYFDREEVERNLCNKQNIISYVDINLPSVKLSNYEFPEVVKQTLFEKLSEQSVSDMMKFYFREILNDIKPIDFDKEQYIPKGNRNQLFYFLVFKSLYGFFRGEYDKDSTEFKYEDNNNNSRYDKIKQFKDDKNGLLKTIIDYVNENENIKQFIEYYKNTGEDVTKNNEKWIRKIDYSKEVKTQIISICAVPPFSLYKDIQEFAFYWALEELHSFVKEINKNANNPQFFVDLHNCKNKPHCEYENIRRYLHLAADLKINYVFSIDMLKAVNVLFNNWGTNGIDRKYTIENSCDSLFDKREDANTLKTDYDFGFVTYYLGIIEQLTKTDEAKAIKVIQNVAELIKKHEISKTDETRLTNDDIESLTLRNNFNNRFIDCLRYLVFENTFIFNTFIELFHKEKKKDLEQFSFDNINYEEFKTKITKYYEEEQQARWHSLHLMLSEYDDEIKPESDTNLETAFYKTVYLKTLLENDKNEKIAENRNIQNANIQKKTEIILQYLSDILGINEKECENGGSYFTVRYKDIDKPEKDIEEDDLYTISQYTNNQMEDKLEMPLTDKDSIVFDLYQGIKEKNNRKPSSLIELFYHKGENKYISSKIERYYSNEEIEINENKIETSCTFDHKYKNLLFLRIADIKEDKKYRKSIEKYIDEILEKKKLPKEFEHYKKFIIEPINSIIILKRLKQKYSNNEKIVEKVNNYIKAIQENDLINFQYFSEEADFPLSIREKFMRKLKNAIEEAKNDNDKIINNVKEVLVEYKRKEVYRSFPVAVLGFYKCRLNENDCPRCPKYKQDKCDEKRFDPKRIRFLLLLRDDIQKFVERHLRNDSFSAYVNETKATIEAKAGEHDYFNLLGRLAENKDSAENFNEIFLLLNDRKNIRELLNTHENIMPAESINVKQEIEKLYNIVFINKINGLIKDIDSIPDDVRIKFPLYIFKSVIYEYIFNGHKTLPDSKSAPQFSIKAIKNIDNSITITICNNFTQEINEQSRKKIEEKGYCDKNPKGLYKNVLLLQYANCLNPKITITNNTFNVEINLINYE